MSTDEDDTPLRQFVNTDEEDSDVDVSESRSTTKDNTEQRHIYSERMQLFFRKFFEGILIWFSLLMLTWDLSIPYASIKTYFWNASDQVTCDCNDCSSSDNCYPSERPYGDTPVFFNSQFRNEFGFYWIAFVTLHVVCAWMVFPLYAIQLFITDPGKYCHKVLGPLVLMILVVLWSFGGVVAVIMVVTRGFHPCAYIIEGFTHTNEYSSAHTQSSFTYILYLLFCYDGAMLNECLMHGTASRLFFAHIFETENKDRMITLKRILKKWHSVLLLHLSASSIWLYLWRTGTTISLLIQFVWILLSDGDTKTKMCVGGIKNPSEDLVIMSLFFVFEMTIIPMVQIPNIKASMFFYKLINNGDYSDLKHWNKKMNNAYHGANLTMAGFIVMWTFLANIGYVFNSDITIFAYIGGFFLLLMWWFCKCQIVRPCPWPYNACCHCCCCFEFCDCQRLCACLIPPKTQKQQIAMLTPRFSGHNSDFI